MKRNILLLPFTGGIIIFFIFSVTQIRADYISHQPDLVKKENHKNYYINLSQVEYPVLKEDFNMGHPGPSGKEIQVNSLYMTIAGEPVLPVMGEFHFSRYDHHYWKKTLQKMKASGVDIVSTYALWIYHEEMEGRINWTGDNNLRKFIELCGNVGLLVHLRIGPYCNAEARNGGFPDWLMEKDYIRKRYNDPLYLAYVRKWYHSIAQQTKGLLYKDGGPVMAIQLENEYVTPGHVVPHLMELKKIAMEEGFDVPVYSMTHWMASDYPKKEIIPYAGYYIETPWSGGFEELPVSNFQFFSYNRISDNIGTDLIKLDDDVQSLNTKKIESPYFTCEVGLGTPTFYHRRPIVPKEMAGANINLRLGCGVNLMGYYMYSGGSHQTGMLTTLESSTSRVSYDYQAPLKEFGTLGTVMNETKKYNYFMNEFGSELATQVAYLPASNNDTSNLQWAVRMHNNQGFLFCSNYLYKRHRQTFEDVQFNIQLKNEMFKVPRQPVDIQDGAYFLWPFNLKMGPVILKYSTTQPVTKVFNDKDKLWVFFQDDEIPAEYFFEKNNIKSINVKDGKISEESDGFFISELMPGTGCIIEIEQKDGSVFKVLTLTEKQSDKIWKIKNQDKQLLALTESGIFTENNELVLFSEKNRQDLMTYPALKKSAGLKEGLFTLYQFQKEEKSFPVKAKIYRPMEESYWVQAATQEGESVITKTIDARSLADVQQATLRCSASGEIFTYLNEEPVRLQQNGNYLTADLSGILKNKFNTIRFVSGQPGLKLIAEIEAMMKNGDRLHWQTDPTWETIKDKKRHPSLLLGKQDKNGLSSFSWQKTDEVAYYEIEVPTDMGSEKEKLRLAVSFKGDRGEAFLDRKLISDYLYDGTDWLIGINRFKEQLQGNKLLFRVQAFNNAQPEVYLEKHVDKTDLDTAQIENIEMRPEYRFRVRLF